MLEKKEGYELVVDMRAYYGVAAVVVFCHKHIFFSSE
jgi:hypothetical protein